MPAIADVDEILAMRGLKPKRGGQGRRGGYEPEQRGEMIRALSHIQNLWINIAEVKVYEKDRQGKRSKQPVLKTLQSRPFIITDRLGQIRLDGDMDVERFIFRPGKAFAAFLFGAGRQTGLLFQKALHYDPLRRKWEKRLTRYISWHWRAVARSGNFVQTYRVQTLLEAVGETVNERYPAKTRARLEKALDTLQADTVIAHWEYARWDEAITERRGWADEWLLATITIEAPDAIKEYYARLGGPDRDTRAIEDKSGGARGARACRRAHQAPPQGARPVAAPGLRAARDPAGLSQQARARPRRALDQARPQDRGLARGVSAAARFQNYKILIPSGLTRGPCCGDRAAAVNGPSGQARGMQCLYNRKGRERRAAAAP